MTDVAIFAYFVLPLIVGALGLGAALQFLWSDNRDLRAREEAKRLKG